MPAQPGPTANSVIIGISNTASTVGVSSRHPAPHPERGAAVHRAQQRLVKPLDLRCGRVSGGVGGAAGECQDPGGGDGAEQTGRKRPWARTSFATGGA